MGLGVLLLIGTGVGVGLGALVLVGTGVGVGLDVLVLVGMGIAVGVGVGCGLDLAVPVGTVLEASAGAVGLTDKSGEPVSAIVGSADSRDDSAVASDCTPGVTAGGGFEHASTSDTTAIAATVVAFTEPSVPTRAC